MRPYATSVCGLKGRVGMGKVAEGSEQLTRASQAKGKRRPCTHTLTHKCAFCATGDAKSMLTENRMPNA
jgi:hypothetical protein